MATPLVVQSERVSGLATLSALVQNVDGDQAVYFTLPGDFGDCLAMEVSALVTGIATLQAAFATSGPMFQLFDAEATANSVSPLYVATWKLVQTAAVAAQVVPDALVFWRAQEALRVAFPEIDTNASPTGDLRVNVAVKRLRVAPQAEREFRLTM